MAVIDSKKLLPPAKSSGSALATQKFLVPISNIKVKSSAIIRASDIKPVEKTEDGGGKIVLSGVLQIRESVVSIQRLIGSNTTLLQQSEERERKLLEKEKFESKEKRLETRKGLSIPQLNIPSLPKTGFLDAIKRFLFYTLLGAAFVKFGKHIPKILEFSKKLIPAFKFLENFAGNILNGAVEFINNGYKAYDKVREISKTIGGEDLQKKFDEFSKQFNTFANLAIIAGMSTMGGTDFSQKSTKPGRPGKGGDWRTEGNVIKGKGGFKQAYDNMLKKGNLTEGEQRVVRDYKRLVKAGYHPDSAANVAFGRNRPELLSGRNVRGGGFSVDVAKDYRTAARGGIVKPKAILGTVRPFLKRIPIPVVGALIDFGLSWALGEDPGRAAFRSIGAGLLGWVGTALGGGIGLAGGPLAIAGAALGGLAGGTLGDMAGGAIYDVFFGGKSTKRQKTQGRAQGGQVTRGGKKVSGPSRRTIKKVRTKPPKVRPQKTIPGKDIGGRKEIEKLFPYSINPNQKSPLGLLETTSESLKKVPLLGGVMGASLDLVMGQKPDVNVFKKIGYGFGALVQNAINTETSNTISNIQKEILGLAGGGVVPRTLTAEENIGTKIGERLAKTLEAMVNSKVNETLQAIRKQFGKSGIFGDGGGLDGGVTGPIEYGPLPLNMTQKQAFATIYELAKKHNASMPELVAAMAMNESGYLTSLLARQYNNPFGQTGSGTKGSTKIPGNSRTFAVYNSLSDAVKFHVEKWNNDSSYGKGAGTYASPVEGLRAILPTYDPGGNHPQYIKNASSILSTMGFDPQKKNPKADLSSQRLVQQRKPTSSGVIPGQYSPGGSSLPLTGDNGRMKPAQLMRVGTLSSSPTGGPYWYGNGAYLRKSDAGPAFIRAKEAAKREGVTFTINSAYRSLEHQRALQGRYAVVAPVGGSPHGEGIALDIETNTRGWTWLKNNGPTYGWRWMAIKNDEVHFEYVGGGISPNKPSTPNVRPASPPSASPPKQRTVMLGGKLWSQHPITKVWTDQFGNRLSNGDFQNRLIQERKGTQASIAPPTTQNLASGINQKASYEIAGGPILMLQKVIVEKLIPVGGGGMISGGVNNSSASISPITASLYSA